MRIKTKPIRCEWVAIAAEIGNRKAKLFWENRLPAGEHPSPDDSSTGGSPAVLSRLVWLQFLRQKYIQRMWIPAGVEMNPLRRSGEDHSDSRGTVAIAK